MAVDYPSGCDVLKLTLNPNDEAYEYHIYPCTMDLSQEKSTFSIAPPEYSARENIKMAMEGMTATIDVNFTIWNDGEDRANGTHSSAVKTIGEQIDWLYEYIHNKNIADSWEIEQVQYYYKGDRLPLNSNGNPKYEAVLTNLNTAPIQKDNVKWIGGNRMTLEVGEVLK